VDAARSSDLVNANFSSTNQNRRVPAHSIEHDTAERSRPTARPIETESMLMAIASRLAKESDRLLASSAVGSFYDRYVRLRLMGCAMALPIPSLRLWKERMRDVIDAPDNRYIPRVPHAGKVRNGRQIMHNGLSIVPGSYYGLPMALMLNRNRGVHEPQEERVFGEMLPYLRADAVMLELGAYWGFYSMWFRKVVPRGVSFLVEPDPANLEYGRENFRLNGVQGTFVQAFVGDKPGRSKQGPLESVDNLAARYGISFIDVLHSDVQGAEYEMLLGASQCFREQKIGYVFISTHSNDLHERCTEFLRSRNFAIVASANLDQTYSYDGLIVGRAEHMTGLESVSIARKPVTRTTSNEGTRATTG
jgi:hypothetical protein